MSAATALAELSTENFAGLRTFYRGEAPLHTRSASRERQREERFDVGGVHYNKPSRRICKPSSPTCEVTSRHLRPGKDLLPQAAGGQSHGRRSSDPVGPSCGRSPTGCAGCRLRVRRRSRGARKDCPPPLPPPSSSSSRFVSA